MYRLALALSLITLVSVAPAIAAPTARVSGSPAVRSGPGHNYDVTGRLPKDATVTLEYCTPDRSAAFPNMPRPRANDGDWCLVRGAGWVDASYLIGWSAKIPVTPPTFLSNPEFHPFDTDEDAQ